MSKSNAMCEKSWRHADNGERERERERERRAMNTTYVVRLSFSPRQSTLVPFSRKSQFCRFLALHATAGKNYEF